FQFFRNVTGGKDGHRRHALDPFAAEPGKIAVGANFVGEVPPVAVHGPNGLSWNDGYIAVVLLHDLRAGQEIDEPVAHGDDRVPGAAAAVGNGPGFVQVVVNGVHAHGAEIDPAGNRVHVRAVHVNKSARFVNQVGDFTEVGFEDAAGVRVGD